MNADWPEFQLGSRCSVKSSKRIFAKEYVENGIPFFRSKDVIDKSFGTFSHYDLFISEVRYQEIKETHGSPSKGDLLISSVGNRSGLPYVVQDEGDFYFKDGNILWLSEFEDINSDYLAYWFKSDLGQETLTSVMIGSAQKALTIDAIRKLWVKLPPIEYQNKAADVLKALDDKIELNRQTNQTLEQIAQAIFKSWFVDFEPVKAKIAAKQAGATSEQIQRAAMCAISGKSLEALEQLSPETLQQLKTTAALFPDALVESELGEIPDGWGVKVVGDACITTDFVANGSFKSLKDNVNLYDEPNDVLYVRTTDFNKGFSNDLKYTDLESFAFLKKSKLYGRETIISNVGDVGTVFRAPVWLGLPMTLGSNAVALISEKYSSYIFWLFRSYEGQNLLQSIVTGSAQLKFNKTNLRSLKIVWPDEGLLAAFEDLEMTFNEKFNALRKETDNLVMVKDSLLPKLLSGELEVNQSLKEVVNG